MEENIIYKDRDPRFNGKVSILVAETEDALNRRQIDQTLLSTSDLARDEF